MSRVGFFAAPSVDPMDFHPIDYRGSLVMSDSEIGAAVRFIKGNARKFLGDRQFEQTPFHLSDIRHP